jgi:hypothetical protein
MNVSLLCSAVSQETSYPVFVFHFLLAEKSKAGNSLFLASMTSDRLAGGPFKMYLRSTDNHHYLANLEFWEDVQSYTAMTTSSAVDLKFRLARNIIVTYLQQGSIREVTLDWKMRERLCYLLRRGQADMILSKIADGMVEVSDVKEFSSTLDEKLR